MREVEECINKPATEWERKGEVSIDQLPGFLSQGIGMDRFERMLQLRQREWRPPATCPLCSITQHQRNTAQHIVQHKAMPEPCP